MCCGLDIIEVPEEIVFNSGSVFDGNDNWYEIGRIRVEGEKGWDCIRKLIEGGVDEYNAMYDGKFYGDYANKMAYKKDNCGKYINEFMYSDGMFMGETKFEDVSGGKKKHIATKVSENGNEYYVIYSNKKMQTFSKYMCEPGDFLTWDAERKVYNFTGLSIGDFIKCLKYYGVYVDDCFQYIEYDSNPSNILKDEAYNAEGKVIEKRIGPRLVKHEKSFSERPLKGEWMSRGEYQRYEAKWFENLISGERNNDIKKSEEEPEK